jgi:hypothetical protein
MMVLSAASKLAEDGHPFEQARNLRLVESRIEIRPQPAGMRLSVAVARPNPSVNWGEACPEAHSHSAWDTDWIVPLHHRRQAHGS